MIRSRPQDLQQSQLPARSARGLEDQTQEGRQVDRSGAREAEQEATGRRAFDGQGVQVAVGLEPGFQVLSPAHDLVGIEDHQARAAPSSRSPEARRRTQGAHRVEGVFVTEVDAELVFPCRAHGALEHGLVEIDGGHASCTGAGGVQGEAAAVGAQVQHAAVARQSGRQAPIVALVAEPAGLVAVARTHHEPQLVLMNPGFTRIERGLLRLKALGSCGRRGDAMHDPQVWIELPEYPLDFLAPAPEPERVMFDDQHRTQLVDHQPRQVVTFAVDDAPGIGHLVQPQPLAPQTVGGRDALQQEVPRPVEIAALAARQDADPNVGRAIVEAVSHEASRAIEHLDQGAVFDRGSLPAAACLLSIGDTDLTAVDPRALGDAVGVQSNVGKAGTHGANPTPRGSHSALAAGCSIRKALCARAGLLPESMNLTLLSAAMLPFIAAIPFPRPQGEQAPEPPQEAPTEELPLPESPAPPPLALVGATVHSMVEGQAPLEATVLIEERRITAIGPQLEVPTGFERVDLSGRHLLPGLIDGMANHDPDHDLLYVDAGVTLIRDNGNERLRILQERLAPMRDRTPGPDLFIAVLILDGNPPATLSSVVLDDELVAAEKLPRLLEDKPDFFSINRGVPLGALRRAIQVAHENGIEVWGYLPTEASFEVAVRARMDGFFGLDPFLDVGQRWDQIEQESLAPRIALAAEERLAVTPLLCALAASLLESREDPPGLDFLGPHYLPTWRQRVREISDGMSDELRALVREALVRQGSLLRSLHEVGVAIVPGSAAPNPLLMPGQGLHDELALLQQAGFSAAEVIAMATAGAARALGIEEQRGTIEVGRLADLLVVEGDPLQDLSLLRHPSEVVAARPALDACRARPKARGVR